MPRQQQRRRVKSFRTNISNEMQLRYEFCSAAWRFHTLIPLSPPQVELEKAKALHAEELAHLTRFDEQLKDLEKAISKKKDAIADCDVQLTKIDGELKGLEVQKQEALAHVKNLEKESWIKEQCQ